MKVPTFMPRLAHADSKSLRFIAPGHTAAVVIAEHHDRPASQRRAKNPFAADIKIVAIDQREYKVGLDDELLRG